MTIIPTVPNTQTTQPLSTADTQQLLDKNGAFINQQFGGSFTKLEDGSEYYTGGTDKNGNVMSPQIKDDGNWRPATVAETTQANQQILNLKQDPSNPDAMVNDDYSGSYSSLSTGAVYYSGGKDPQGNNVPPSVYDNGEWREATKDEMGLGTVEMLGLKVNTEASSTYAVGTASRESHTGTYALMEDGNTFYTGGDGPTTSDQPAQIFENGQWRNANADETSTGNILALGLTENSPGSGIYSKEGSLGTYTANSDGSISYSGDPNAKPQVYRNGDWTDI